VVSGINLKETCLLFRWLLVLRLQECNTGFYWEQGKTKRRCKVKNSNHQNYENESSDASFSFGRTHRSVKTVVMTVERRGSIILTSEK